MGTRRLELVGISLLFAIAVVLAVGDGVARGAAGARVVSFSFTGSEQSYTVPAGVTSLKVVAVGARGGNGANALPGDCLNTCYGVAPGGSGARVTASLDVTPGEVLYVEVGGAGGDAVTYTGGNGFISTTPGGFNGGGSSPWTNGGGGGGGGASDVRTLPAGADGTLSSRLVVAGGGGGGGSQGFCFQTFFQVPGPSGGSTIGPLGLNGGNGGFPSYCLDGNDITAWGGGGASPELPGSASFETGQLDYFCNGAVGGARGSFGAGGAGGWENGFNGGRVAATGGGGGGGGYYGGGGGAGGPTCALPDFAASGGGGGGSSYVTPAATGVSYGSATTDAEVVFELVSSSTTSVACSPASTGSASLDCAATVTDPSDSPVAPTGTVSFSTNGTGVFTSSSCALAATGISSASCETTYQPGANSNPGATISASYGGDDLHTASSGSVVADADLAITDVPADVTVDATSPAGAAVSYTSPSAVDEDSPAPAVSCDPASGSTFPIGTTTVTCSATDADDSPTTVSGSFTVTVNDTDLALTSVPADITTAATSSDGAVVNYTAPTVVDEDTSLPAPLCDHPSGSTFPVGKTIVTCTVSDPDDSNGAVSASFTVDVTDSDLALTGTPGDITTNATGPSGAVVSYTPPTVVDEDSPLPSASCDHPSGSTLAIGTTTVTCTVSDTDDANSPVSSAFTVTVVGAAGQLQQLIAAAGGAGSGASFSSKLQTALADLAAGDTRDARGVLTGFVNEVRAQTGKKVGQAQAAQLIGAAEQIESVIG